MYGKLFAMMYDGTLGTKGPWQALVTFQQLIILADQVGHVDMTAEALSRRTTIPLEVIRVGLEALQQPDPDSRTPDEDGRRITLLAPPRSWGWRIVNYEHYRKIRSAEERREYHRTYQADKRAGLPPGQRAVARSTPSTKSTNSSKQEAEVEEGGAVAPSAADEVRTQLLDGVLGKVALEAFESLSAGIHQNITAQLVLDQAKISGWYIVQCALVDMAGRNVRFSRGSFEKFVRGVRDLRHARTAGSAPGTAYIGPKLWCEECGDGDTRAKNGTGRLERIHKSNCSRSPA